MSKTFFDLSDKIILITGAGGHLGSAIAQRVHQAGATVLLNGRAREKLEALPFLGERTDIHDFDLADESAVDKALEGIKGKYGRLDGLVNNAYLPLAASIDEASKDIFQQCFEVNVSATFALSQKCFSLLERNKGKTSSIVNIASMYGVVSPDPSIYGDSGMNNPPFYGVSKAAILQLTRYFAGHITDRGIRTNAVSPGPFPPESIKNDMPEFHEQLCQKTPMKRIGDPEEVAAAVHFLLSDDSSYINGANIAVDGGWTAW